MDVRRIIADIDAEIAKLENIKATLGGLSTGTTTAPATTGRRGRPKGSKNLPKSAASTAKPAATAAKAKGKRRLSPEGRAAIAAAMKRRWAEHRKEAKKDK